VNHYAIDRWDYSREAVIVC